MPIRMRCDAMAKNAIEIAETAGRIAVIALEKTELRARWGSIFNPIAGVRGNGMRVSKDPVDFDEQHAAADKAEDDAVNPSVPSTNSDGHT
jgi:hypothetical protein